MELFYWLHWLYWFNWLKTTGSRISEITNQTNVTNQTNETGLWLLTCNPLILYRYAINCQIKYSHQKKSPCKTGICMGGVSETTGLQGYNASAVHLALI